MADSSPIRGFVRFLASEVGLVLGRRRNQAGLVVLAAVPVMMAFAIRSAGDGVFGSILAGNGLIVPIGALIAEAPFFLPLAVSMLAGDAIAGEAHQGTLRYLLAVPAGRTRLLAVKLLSLFAGCLIGVGIIGVVGTLMGVVMLGAGPMITLSGSQLGFGAALGRVALMYLYYAALLAGFAALGLFVSTLTEQPLGATVAIMVVNILGWIAEAIEQLDWLHPWLLTHWMTSFTDLMSEPMLTTNVSRGLWLALGYVAVFTLAAWARFTTRDVTS
ncbi:ABC transporter permease [Brooklawnia cerclae]|uniref:ABC-2 type transport system permease protein n=1 Tax=Brooklawnia cerclae TaxID=349934 RepID=A0ABX0SJ86_9ACTN|nr:ABC transporter permease subunit [Brooklawnia cerclae]NIH56796.1 ABC-2 type transport system permease protein [Brooklawnia cerclae]